VDIRWVILFISCWSLPLSSYWSGSFRGGGLFRKKESWPPAAVALYTLNRTPKGMNLWSKRVQKTTVKKGESTNENNV
jgi:hypothetical protein